MMNVMKKVVCLNASKQIFGRHLFLTTCMCSDENIIHSPDNYQFISKPERKNEPIEQRRARLVYQSRKRGMLENDLLLSTFVDKYLKGFGEKEIEEYDNLINGPSNDWDLYYWATEVKPTPKEYEHDVMKLLKEHCKNIEKKPRLRQPDL